jgi:hypothetical protein
VAVDIAAHGALVSRWRQVDHIAASARVGVSLAVGDRVGRGLGCGIRVLATFVLVAALPACALIDAAKSDGPDDSSGGTPPPGCPDPSNPDCPALCSNPGFLGPVPIRQTVNVCSSEVRNPLLPNCGDASGPTAASVFAFDLDRDGPVAMCMFDTSGQGRPFNAYITDECTEPPTGVACVPDNSCTEIGLSAGSHHLTVQAASDCADINLVAFDPSVPCDFDGECGAIDASFLCHVDPSGSVGTCGPPCDFVDWCGVIGATCVGRTCTHLQGAGTSQPAP